eukprot:gene2110-biopygen23759
MPAPPAPPPVALHPPWRARPPGQEAMAKRLWHEGWQVTWGQAQPPGRRTGGADQIFGANSLGVGVMVRRGLPMQAGPRDTERRKRLWATGRWTHCVIGTGNGAQALHVMSLYGHTGANQFANDKKACGGKQAYEANEKLLADTLEAAAELGDVPVLILGDFNVRPEDSAALRDAVLAGGWQDLALAQAEALQVEADHTCYPANGGDSSRIDIAFGNGAALAATRGVAVLQDAGFSVHKPVQASLDMDTYAQRVRTVNKPAAFPIEDWVDWTAEACDEAAGGAADEVQHAWDEAKRKRDVEGLWRLFNSAAERYLTERSADAPGFRKTRRHQGRGQCRAERQRFLSAHQRKEAQGALNVVQRRAARLQGQLRELLRQRLRQGVGRGASEDEMRSLWRVTRKLGREMIVEEPYAVAWAATDPPEVERCKDLLEVIHQQIEDLNRTVREGRAKRWREWAATSWERARGKLYQWCKGEQQAPVHMVRRKDGSYTGEVCEMDRLLRAAWGKIFRKHAAPYDRTASGQEVTLTPEGWPAGVPGHRQRATVTRAGPEGVWVRWSASARDQHAAAGINLPDEQQIQQEWWEGEGHAVAEPSWDRASFGQYIRESPMQVEDLDAPRLRE